tara:strand:- start:226 stop:942 length:717 start_codon:yes stop_codon:yes gene_type:complete
LKYPTLLITSAIQPNEGIAHLKLVSPKERLKYTLNGIKKWKELIPKLRIVIVDGTNFELTTHVDSDVECICYKNDIFLDPRKGKSAGEAQDIVYALKNSEYIKQYPNVMKVTGKRWVQNIKHFKRNDLFTRFKCKPIFSNTLSLIYINTSFLCFDRDYYLSLFENMSNEINENYHHRDIEHIMAEILIEKKVRHYTFEKIPNVDGWDGTGNYSILDLYPDKIKHQFRKLKYKIISKIK